MRKVELQEKLNQLRQTITETRADLDLFDRGSEEAKKLMEKYSFLREQEIMYEQQLGFIDKKAKRLLDQAHLSKKFASRTFNNFDPTGNETAYKLSFEYARDFAYNNGEGLMLIGGYGTGKTHLAASITNYVLAEHGVPVRFITSVELMEALKAFRDDTAKRTLAEVERIELLVIDDLGKEKATDFSKEKFFQIINKRYEDELPIVITTNETPQAMRESIGGATFSRLCEMCKAVRVLGDDRRLKNDCES